MKRRLSRKAFRLTKKLVPKEVFKPIFRRVVGHVGPTKSQIDSAAERIANKVIGAYTERVSKEKETLKVKELPDEVLENIETEMREWKLQLVLDYAVSSSIKNVVAQLGVKLDKRRALFEATKTWMDRQYELGKARGSRAAFVDDISIGLMRRKVFEILGPEKGKKFVNAVNKKFESTLPKVEAAVQSQMLEIIANEYKGK